MNHTDHISTLDVPGASSGEGNTEGLATPFGRRKFIAGVGTAAGAAVLATALPSGTARALPPEAAKFVALTVPKRIADTRGPGNYSWVDKSRIRVPLLGLYGVPTDATAVVGTVTAVNRGEGTAVTVMPSGGVVPLASNLNVATNDMNANLATVKIANGGIDIYTTNPADLLFDLVGYYVPVTEAVPDGRFIPLPDPVRAYDSRDAPRLGRVGSEETVVIDVSTWVPADASAVAINLTTDRTTEPTYLTAFPTPVVFANGAPETSSLNVSPTGAMRASAVVVQVSDINNTRTFKVYVRRAANVIVDVIGYFTGPNSESSTVGLFVPSNPLRLVDTRDKGPNGRVWNNWKLEVEVPADAAANGSAIVANVTMVKNYGPNILKVTGARQSLPANFSNVNAYTAGMIVPNHVTSRITSLPENPGKSAIQIFTEQPTNIIVDYAGYYTGSPASPRLAYQPNPQPAGSPPAWTINFNKPIGAAGQTTMPPTLDGDPLQVTDSGFVWHWQGTGYVGDPAHVAVFGHRTTHGAPFARIDTLGPGDTWTVDTSDGRRYTYMYATRILTDANTGNILNATRAVPGNTMALIACTIGTQPNPFGPTSTRYRIVVVGVEVGWTAIW